MANPFVKAWKYFMALFDSKIDEHADPKVQIQQAIEEAQRQHQELSQQAAAVIGNQRQLEMQLNRRLADIEKLQANTRQAIQLADKARASGDIQKATEYENAAEAFAAQLVTAEQSVEDTKKLHDQALQQASAAKKAVERNSMALQQKVAERTNALGSAELAENTVQGRMAEIEQAGVQMAGHSRLEQIRAQMAGELSPGTSASPQQSIEAAKPQASVADDAVARRMRELRGDL